MADMSIKQFKQQILENAIKASQNESIVFLVVRYLDKKSNSYVMDKPHYAYCRICDLHTTDKVLYVVTPDDGYYVADCLSE